MKTTAPTIMIGHLKVISIDEAQFYIAHNVDLHPTLSIKFIYAIADMELHQKICLLPATKLTHYSHKIKQRLTKSDKRVQKSA